MAGEMHCYVANEKLARVVTPRANWMAPETDSFLMWGNRDGDGSNVAGKQGHSRPADGGLSTNAGSL
jgi:hypothetical protein